MASGLVDSSILIDVLRGYVPALTWMKTTTDLAVSSVVWIEVLEGVENRRKQQSALKLLESFQLIELIERDFQAARQLLIQYNLSHGADGYDCLIAATSQRLKLPLYTHNLKHFTPMISSLAIKPY